MSPSYDEQSTIDVATPLEQGIAPQPAAFHKYKYEVFDGFAGERILFSLAQKFAPYALCRTWYAAVSYQAPGESCYVGVPRLTDEREGRVGVQERKIYLDLAALEARGWLVQEYVQKPFKAKSGEMVLRVVPQKNFEGFYDTAYDYFLWLNDPTYIAPRRDNVALIRANPELVKRLIHFENYRRLLVCAKPGRKPQMAHQDFYHCQLVQADQMGGEEDQGVNQYSNTPAKSDSLYRIPSNSESTRRDIGSEDSTAKEDEGVVASAIRNLQTRASTNNLVPKSTPKPPSTEGEQGGGYAKGLIEVLGYTENELKQDSRKRGAAAVGISADQYNKLNGGKDQAERDEVQQQQAPLAPPRPARELPSAVTRAITEFAMLYDDEHLVRSDVTRGAKLFFTAEQTLAGFDDTLFFTLFDQARKAALKKTNCEYTNGRGRSNRVPFFFTCLENACSFSLEELIYLRSEDALFSDYSIWDVIENIRNNYQRLFNTGQINVDYRAWLCDILDKFEKRKEPKKRFNKTAHE